jgi:hypothetical protein
MEKVPARRGSRFSESLGCIQETLVRREAVIGCVLLALLLLAPAAGLAQDLVDDPYHHLALTSVPSSKSSICMDTQSDSLYGVYQKSLYVGNGTGWWRTVKSWSSPVTGLGRDTFVDSNGNVYVSLNGSSQLARGAYNNGGKRQWTYPVTFNCSGANFWHMAEDADGNLYFGEYSTCTEPCHCAFVWKSTDSGETWACTDSIESRHVHGIWTDATQETLYMSVGDGPPALEQSLLYRSTNAGEDWDLLRSGDLLAQPVSSVGTAAGYQIWGGDAGSMAVMSPIYRSHGSDTEFETTFMPQLFSNDAFTWTMSRNGRGVIFCGTVVKRNNLTQTGILRSDDAGATWSRVLNLGTGPAFNGVLFMTTRFGANRCGYFYDNTTVPAHLWRFRDACFTVGDGGDYATIADALLQTGPADTLILLPGTHDADDCTLHDSMTIRGATTDESLYRIRSGDAEHAAIVVDSTAVIRSITFTGPDGGFAARDTIGPSPGDSVFAVIRCTGGGTVSDCAFNCGTGYAVYAPGRALTLTNNVFDGSGAAVAILDGTSLISGNVFPGSTKTIELSGGTFRGGGTIRALEPGASYHVMGDLRVGDSGSAKTLTIEPGTALEFDTGTGIQVGYASWRGYYGKLAAVGTEAEPIVFGPLSGQQGDWKGVYFPYGLAKGGTLRHCVISAGGQIWDGQSADIIDMCDFGSSVVVDSCTIRLSSGCGIYSRWGAAHITRSTISENVGDGVYCKAGFLTVDGSIVCSSSTAHGLSGESAVGFISCTNVWNNAAGNYGGSIEDQTGSNGNISANPVFCDAAGGDYHLDASSPCLGENSCGQIGSFGKGCGECDVVEPWSVMATALPDSVRDHGGVVLGDFAYISGGLVAGGLCTDATVVASLDAKDIPLWTPTAALPDSVRDHCMVSAGGWIYSLGGGEGVSGTAENPMFREVHDYVWKAAPSEDGGLVSWETAAPLPVPLWGAGAAVWDGRIYVGGGSSSDSLLGAPSDRIYSAPLAPDGSVGPWSEDPVHLPEAVASLQLLARGGRLWVVGGQAGPPGHEPRAGVASAEILPDGTLDPDWVTADPLPEARHSFGAVLDPAGSLYVVGGADSSGASRRSIYLTHLLPDGEIAQWDICDEGIPALPGLDPAFGLSHMPCWYYDHHMYLAGGYGQATTAGHGFRAEVLTSELIPGEPTDVPGDDDDGTGDLPADARFAICAVRPNPLSLSTRITYAVPTPGCTVSLRIYDVRGREVRTLVEAGLREGLHEIAWDGRTNDGTPAASGIYFCRLASDGRSDTKKLTLLR